MSHSRKSAAPYSAQLKKLLANPNGVRTFSAASLAERFELRPSEARRTTINRIHQALRRAWEAGDVLAYVAPDGTELVEKEFCVNGSAAVEHPQIYGLLGTPSPEAGYEPTSYQDHVAANAGRNRPEEPEPPAGEGELVVGEAADDSPDEVVADDGAETDGSDADQDVAVAECLEDVAAFGIDDVAPQWLPDRLLHHLVTLPKVVRVLRQGLDRAQGTEKLQLIRTGLRRKGDIDPVIARKLAELCRANAEWWGRVFYAAVEQYAEWGEGIADDDLPALRRGPDAFWVEHETDYHPEAMVLWGIQLGADGEALRAVAQEAVSLLDDEEDQETVSVQDELRHRIASLDAEAAELRRQLDDRDETIQARDQRIRELAADVEELRAAGTGAGGVDEQLATVERQVREQRDEIVGLSARLRAGAGPPGRGRRAAAADGDAGARTRRAGHAGRRRGAGTAAA